MLNQTKSTNQANVFKSTSDKVTENRQRLFKAQRKVEIAADALLGLSELFCSNYSDDELELSATGRRGISGLLELLGNELWTQAEIIPMTDNDLDALQRRGGHE